MGSYATESPGVESDDRIVEPSRRVKPLRSHGMGEIRMAVVGCGAVSERIHLPVASRIDGVAVTTLVDPSLERARRLAGMYSVPRVVGDHREVAEDVDAAIVAAPHHHHAAITCDLLARGIHCLVEKPMALSSTDGRRMLDTASASGATLAVGLLRRLYPSSRYVKQVLDRGILGDLTDFEMREGSVYGWQVATDSVFRPEEGGGVLADLGSHVLDLMMFWLGELDVVSYKDDAMGGVEADCIIQAMRHDGVVGTVELSRSRRLPNHYIFRGQRATLRVTADGGDSNPSVSLILDGERLTGHVETTHTKWLDTAADQLEVFLAAIRGEGEPAVSGADGLRAIEFMERCRELREPWVYPWLIPEKRAVP